MIGEEIKLQKKKGGLGLARFII